MSSFRGLLGRVSRRGLRQWSALERDLKALGGGIGEQPTSIWSPALHSRQQQELLQLRNKPSYSAVASFPSSLSATLQSRNKQIASPHTFEHSSQPGHPPCLEAFFSPPPSPNRLDHARCLQTVAARSSAEPADPAHSQSTSDGRTLAPGVDQRGKESPFVTLEDAHQYHYVPHLDSIPKSLLTKPGPNEKPRVVILGSGWAACRLLHGLNLKLWDVVCISPRNHMVFTPLLASTCVGTLEFRSVAEPIENIQRAVSTLPGSFFFLAHCLSIDTVNREVACISEGEESVGGNPDGWRFRVAYDKLVIAAGAAASTFGIHGVHEHAIFLREVRDAMAIRSKLLLNLLKCQTPGLPEEEKQRLLSIVVVGGGPTGVEFSGELSDFIARDVRRKFAHVKDYIHVTLIEAREILSNFDVGLRKYATNHLNKVGVKLKHGMVKDVLDDHLVLDDGSKMPYGVLVWSTGVGPTELTKALPFTKSPGGRIGVDEYLRVPEASDVYALGDCAGYLEDTGKSVLPALAQVAERQGKYMAQILNSLARAGAGRAGATLDADSGSIRMEPFTYRHLGSMATVGRYKALIDLRQGNEGKMSLRLAGFLSWLVWRSAYLTRVVSWRNRFYVAVNWLTTLLFGRDISRI